MYPISTFYTRIGVVKLIMTLKAQMTHTATPKLFSCIVYARYIQIIVPVESPKNSRKSMTVTNIMMEFL